MFLFSRIDECFFYNKRVTNTGFLQTGSQYGRFKNDDKEGAMDLGLKNKVALVAGEAWGWEKPWR